MVKRATLTNIGNSKSILPKTVGSILASSFMVIGMSSSSQAKEHLQMVRWNHKTDIVYFKSLTTKRIYRTPIQNIRFGDMDRVRKLDIKVSDSLLSPDIIRQEILIDGGGWIIDDKKGSLNEITAQNNAIKAKAGIWQPGFIDKYASTETKKILNSYQASVGKMAQLPALIKSVNSELSYLPEVAISSSLVKNSKKNSGESEFGYYMAIIEAEKNVELKAENVELKNKLEETRRTLFIKLLENQEYAKLNFFQRTGYDIYNYAIKKNSTAYTVYGVWVAILALLYVILKDMVIGFEIARRRFIDTVS